MQTPAIHDWDNPSLKLVETDHSDPAFAQAGTAGSAVEKTDHSEPAPVQPEPAVETIRTRTTRKPRKTPASDVKPQPESLSSAPVPAGFVLNLPNAQGNFRVSVVDGELLVRQDTKPTVQLGGVTRQGHVLSKRPIVADQPVLEKARVLAVADGALHIRLSGRALFFTFFCLVWTLVFARFLGVA